MASGGIFATSVFVLFLSQAISSAAACEAVGVAEDIKEIPDGRMTASTIYNTFYEPYYGRLNSNRGGWCPKTTSDRTDYLQVDMGAARFVCAVATQRIINDCTETYYLQFSLDGVTWNIYKQNNIQKNFAGSTDSSVVRVPLDPAVEAKFVRFYPITYKLWPCLNVEIYSEAHDQHCGFVGTQSNFTELGNATELGTFTGGACSGMSYFLVKGCTISDDCYTITCEINFLKKPITLTLKINCDDPVSLTVTLDVKFPRITWSHTFTAEKPIEVPGLILSLDPVGSVGVYVQVGLCANGDKLRLKVKLLAGLKVLGKLTTFPFKLTVIDGNLPFSCGGWSVGNIVGTTSGIIGFITICCCCYCCYNCCCKSEN